MPSYQPTPDLIFTLPANPSPHLVFGGGEGGDGPVGDDAFVTPSGAFPAFSGTLRAVHVEVMAVTPSGGFPAFAGRLSVRWVEDYPVLLSGEFPAFDGQIKGTYDPGISRALGGRVSSRYQQAQARPVALGSDCTDARNIGIPQADRYQQGIGVDVPCVGVLETTRTLNTVQQGRYQQAQSVQMWADYGFAATNALRQALGGRYQHAQVLRTSAQYAFQTATMFRQLLGGRYQQAAMGRVLHEGSGRLALAINCRAFAGRYQVAMQPQPGLYVPPGPDPDGDHGCYHPSPHLLFCTTPDGTANLLFRCCGGGGEPATTIYVPIQKAYIVQNSISLTRVDNGAELHPLTFSLALDADSWTFQWSASLHQAAGAHLGRQDDGEVPKMLAIINGQQFMLRLESRSLDERFIPNRWSVSGRGQAAILSAPHAPAQSFSNTSERTAAQLANDVLTINGVPMGWELDWQIDDWQVPAAAWTHQGTYITALTDIATAVGAYIQPHPTAQTLHVLPRYPVLPWAWDDVTPHYDLPAGMAEVRGTEYAERTPYNRIYVGGESKGVFGHITRAGTAGELLAPQVLHPLITSAVAQRMRGGAELANTGNQEHVAITTQVLPETGIILPGKFVRHSFPQASGRRLFGIVRKVSINYSMPKLRQTITLETHPNV